MGYPSLCKGPCAPNTYQFHFFVLPMIFMPNPTAPYLCSQLASVTKGLCKQLLQANRFLPTSEKTASYAAPICPPGMHKNMSPIFIFSLLLAVQFRGRCGGKRRMRSRSINKTSTETEGCINLSFSLCVGTALLKQSSDCSVSSPLHVGFVCLTFWRG